MRLINMIRFLLLQLLISVVLSFTVFSQNEIIEGRIVEKNSQEAIANVEIFISGTTIGTTTNEEGKFRLIAPNTPCHLGIMHISYESKVLTVKSGSYINIEMDKALRDINEVLVKAKNYRKRNLRLFYKYFFHETDKSMIRILNDSVLRFKRSDYDFHAYSKSPLIIENNYLGYKVTLLLRDFYVCKKKFDSNERVPLNSMNGHNVFKLIGFYYYQEISKTHPIFQKTFDKNRRLHYYGSLRHFLSSLYNNRLKQNGFEFCATKNNNTPQLAEKDMNKTLKKYSFVTDTLKIYYYFDDYGRPINLMNKLDRVHYQTSTLVSRGEDFVIRENGTSSELPFDMMGEMAKKSLINTLPEDYEPN